MLKKNSTDILRNMVSQFIVRSKMRRLIVLLRLYGKYSAAASSQLA